jgi:hypothetical protein
MWRFLSFFGSRYGDFFLISKIPFLDSPAFCFCRQVAKIRQKEKKLKKKKTQ